MNNYTFSETLLHNLREFLSDDVSETIGQISSILAVDNLYQTVAAAQELRDHFIASQLEQSTYISLLDDEPSNARATLIQNLRNNLPVVQVLVAENTQKIYPRIENKTLQKLSDILDALFSGLTALSSGAVPLEILDEKIVESNKDTKFNDKTIENELNNEGDVETQATANKLQSNARIENVTNADLNISKAEALSKPVQSEGKPSFTESEFILPCQYDQDNAEIIGAKVDEQMDDQIKYDETKFKDNIITADTNIITTQEDIDIETSEETDTFSVPKSTHQINEEVTSKPLDLIQEIISEPNDLVALEQHTKPNIIDIIQKTDKIESVGPFEVVNITDSLSKPVIQIAVLDESLDSNISGELSSKLLEYVEQYQDTKDLRPIEVDEMIFTKNKEIVEDIDPYGSIDELSHSLLEPVTQKPILTEALQTGILVESMLKLTENVQELQDMTAGTSEAMPVKSDQILTKESSDIIDDNKQCEAIVQVNKSLLVPTTQEYILVDTIGPTIPEESTLHLSEYQPALQNIISCTNVLMPNQDDKTAVTGYVEILESVNECDAAPELSNSSLASETQEPISKTISDANNSKETISQLPEYKHENALSIDAKKIMLCELERDTRGNNDNKEIIETCKVIDILNDPLLVSEIREPVISEVFEPYNSTESIPLQPQCSLEPQSFNSDLKDLVPVEIGKILLKENKDDINPDEVIVNFIDTEPVLPETYDHKNSTEMPSLLPEYAQRLQAVSDNKESILCDSQIESIELPADKTVTKVDLVSSDSLLLSDTQERLLNEIVEPNIIKDSISESDLSVESQEMKNIDLSNTLLVSETQEVLGINVTLEQSQLESVQDLRGIVSDAKLIPIGVVEEAYTENGKGLENIEYNASAHLSEPLLVHENHKIVFLETSEAIPPIKAISQIPKYIQQQGDVSDIKETMPCEQEIYIDVNESVELNENIKMCEAKIEALELKINEESTSRPHHVQEQAVDADNRDSKRSIKFADIAVKKNTETTENIEPCDVNVDLSNYLKVTDVQEHMDETMKPSMTVIGKNLRFYEANLI